jgi:hypothetical protein
MKGRYHIGYLGIDRIVILKWILEKGVVKMWTGFIWLRTGTSKEWGLMGEHRNLQVL